MRNILLITFFSFSLAIALPGCGGGGGGGGGSNNVSCAPDNPADATVTLNTATLGRWTLVLTETSSTCPSAPDSITCLLDMVVTGNDVAISGTCTPSPNPFGISVNVGGVSGVVSGDTLYWGGTMTGSADGYSETDTVPCTDVEFPSNIESETFSVTVSVEYDTGDTDGTCTTSFSGKFQ